MLYESLRTPAFPSDFQILLASDGKLLFSFDRMHRYLEYVLDSLFSRHEELPTAILYGPSTVSNHTYYITIITYAFIAVVLSQVLAASSVFDLIIFSIMFLPMLQFESFPVYQRLQDIIQNL